MPLIIIVLAAGLFIELLGTVISVAGVAAMTNTNLIIIAFVIALDIGKVATISVLYQYWEKLGITLRSLGIVMAVATISISSFEAGGYLSNELKKSLLGPQTQQIEVAALEAQIQKYEERKLQIDSQIANVPEKTSVAARIRLMNTFKEEQKAVTARIAEIEAQLPALKQEHAKSESLAGPIFALSKQLGVTVEVAVNLVVGLLIVVFNPFAVYLIVLGNFMIKRLKHTEEVVPVVPAVYTEPEVVVAPAIEPAIEPTPKPVAEVVLELEPIPEPEVIPEVAPEAAIVPEIVPEPEVIVPEVHATIPEHVIQELAEELVNEDITPVLLTPDLVEEEPEHITRAEERRREKRVSLLLDKALAHIPDGTTITSVPLKTTEYSRDL